MNGGQTNFLLNLERLRTDVAVLGGTSGISVAAASMEAAENLARLGGTKQGMKAAAMPTSLHIGNETCLSSHSHRQIEHYHWKLSIAHVLFLELELRRSYLAVRIGRRGFVSTAKGKPHLFRSEWKKVLSTECGPARPKPWYKRNSVTRPPSPYESESTNASTPLSSTSWSAMYLEKYKFLNNFITEGKKVPDWDVAQYVAEKVERYECVDVWGDRLKVAAIVSATSLGVDSGEAVKRLGMMDMRREASDHPANVMASIVGGRASVARGLVKRLKRLRYGWAGRVNDECPLFAEGGYLNETTLLDVQDAFDFDAALNGPEDFDGSIRIAGEFVDKVPEAVVSFVIAMEMEEIIEMADSLKQALAGARRVLINVLECINLSVDKFVINYAAHSVPPSNTDTVPIYEEAAQRALKKVPHNSTCAELLMKFGEVVGKKKLNKVSHINDGDGVLFALPDEIDNGTPENESPMASERKQPVRNQYPAMLVRQISSFNADILKTDWLGKSVLSNDRCPFLTFLFHCARHGKTPVSHEETLAEHNVTREDPKEVVLDLDVNLMRLFLLARTLEMPPWMRPLIGYKP